MSVIYLWPDQGVLVASSQSSSARLVCTVGGAVTFVLCFAVRHLENEALSNQAQNGRIEEDAWGRGYGTRTFII